MIDTNNPYQGKYKRVLFVCTAGMLRSATAARLFSLPPYDWNTRACGAAHYALIPLTDSLLYWADEIYCMERKHALAVEELLPDMMFKVKVLDIGDVYMYRDARLEELLRRRIEEASEYEPALPDA